jgi:uncharacterized protein YjbJ (UPF0337 family)
MNWAELQRDWRGRASVLLKSYWPRLTDDDLERAGGRRDGLAAALAARYGYNAEQAEQAIAAFEKEVRFPGAVK